MVIPDQKVKIGMTKNIGCLCFGSPFTAQLRFGKNRYVCGEKTNAKIKCDNTLCKRKIETVSFALI